MSLDRIESTSLWRNSLAFRKKDEHEKKREELRSAFIKFRDSASYLVSNISKSLPNLTQHDASHLDALWDIASLITGEKYPLNPLEAFVLGGAILLHDSALCFEAYDGGVNGIRETIVWKDAYASTIDSYKDRLEDEIISIADFVTLRQLHAEQSATLIEKGWPDPDTGEILYLIENSTLRKHLGQLIGQISASHHWDIEKVAMIFSSQNNALATFPRDWRIDPLKIACILRCSDAAHIDNERAPDFLHALIVRQGLSFHHWQAQNRLAVVDLDQSDANGESLLFTSTKSFTEEESNSWWIAYDAACLVDKELRTSNALLETRQTGSTMPFKAKRVKGVESPELMTNYIKVDGWLPCSAEIHVGNVEKLVRNLGGEQLYASGVDSDLLQVTIRELVQNARDSIQARYTIDKNFIGKITIRLDNTESSTWLTIEDNGIGMSERVLTGPLLDFGTSFWTSALVQSEFPGLRSSTFKAVGRFGIGFYSVFMTASEVYITSRPWKEGINNAKQIQFKKGLSFRPLLKNGPSEDFGSLTSTKIKLKLKDGIITEDACRVIKRNLMGASDIAANFKDYLSAICAGLDVSIFFAHNQDNEVIIHQNIYDNDFDYKKWLKGISFSEYQDIHVTSYIDKNVSRLRYIEENGIFFGLAAISTLRRDDQNFLSIKTIGGLATTVHAREGSLFIGYIDTLPKSAKRELNMDYAASPETIKKWAQEQMEIFSHEPISDLERYIIAGNLSQFKVDPTPIASILVIFNKIEQFKSIDDLAILAESTGIIFLKSVYTDSCEYIQNVDVGDGYIMIQPIVSNNFLNLKLINNVPSVEYSLLNFIYKKIISNNKEPLIRIEPTEIKSRFAGNVDALILTAQ